MLRTSPRRRFCFLFFQRFIFWSLLALVPLWPSVAVAAPLQLLAQINHIAGSGGAAFSGDGGSASAAGLNLPQGVAVDGGGNLYIADTANNRVRRVDAATGIISTVAGNGQQGFAGDGALAVNAELKLPEGIAVDIYGNLWIADTGNSVIREVTASTGNITTVAGNGTPGFAGNGGPATSAELNLPAAIVVDAAGDLFIADTANNRVRRVDHATQIITTFAGTGSTGFTSYGGLATATSLSAPQGIALDSTGDVYVSDTGHNLVAEIVGGTINIVAGVAGSSGYNGDGGSATSAYLSGPTGIVLDENGNLYISDSANARIREVIIITGTISTLAGNGTAGFNNTDGALATSAEINQPFGLAVDAVGQLYLADTANSALRVIADGRHFPTAALDLGTPIPRYLYLQINTSLTLNSLTVSAGEGSKPEFALSTISSPHAFPIGAMTACTAGTPYTSTSPPEICIVPLTYAPVYPGQRTASLTIATVSSGTVIYGLSGIGQGPETVLTPGVISTILPLLGGSLTQPTYQQLAVDPQGDVFVADKTDNEIYVWCAGANASLTCTSNGQKVVFVGPSGSGAVVVTSTLNALNAPTAVALDAAGNLFIANSGGNNILRVDAATQVITTAAGSSTGTAGSSGDGGPATGAKLNDPNGIAATTDGTLYIADTGNNVVRRVDGVTGIITHFAGGPGSGGYGDGHLAATEAELHTPIGVALDDQQRLYIADSANDVIRMVDPVTGIIQTVAGKNNASGGGYSGDGGPATSALLAVPVAVAVDAAGDLYIADSDNARIRRVDALSGFIETIAGTDQSGNTGDGGPATSAELTSPAGVGVDALGQVVLADQAVGAVRSITAPLSAPLAFGPTAVGCGVSPIIAVELANIGNETLSLSSLAVPADFSLLNVNSHTCVANAQQYSGSVCDMDFAFTPTVPGTINEAASVTDNDLYVVGSIQGISMSGIGEPLNVVPTTMTVTASPVSLAYGSPVVLTATVTSSQGPVPTGTVMFSVNGVEVGSSTLNASGVATLTIPAGPTGTNLMVLASHSQQCNYGPSSAQTSLTVIPAATEITLIASATQVEYGQPVTLEAIVTAVTSGVPTGLVNIMDGSTQIGQATLNGTGYATITLNQAALPLGPNAFTADYLGDPNFIPSTSNIVVVNVYDAKLTMAIHPNVVSLSAATSAQIQVTLTPENGFNSPVTMSCAGLIAGATCSFSPQTIAFTSQMQTQQITLTIQSNILVTAGVGSSRGGWKYLGWMLMLLTVLGSFLLQRARSRAGLHQAMYLWMLAVAIGVGSCASLGILSGCGGGAPLPPYTSTVMVQAYTPAQGVLAQQSFQLNLGQ